MLDTITDLETMGRRPSAPIIAIGAVAFDVALGATGDEFYVSVDLESSVRSGALIEPDAVVWWAKQSDAARAVLSDPGAVTLREALERFSEFMARQGDAKAVRLWGNGSDFDNVILAESYARLGMTPPWEFWNNRCYRTLKNRYPRIKLERVGELHNALDDARSQTRHLLAIEQAAAVPVATLRGAA